MNQDSGRTGADATSAVGKPTQTAGARPAFPSTPTEAHPTQIGPYKILEVLGEGGMGVVYLAEQSKPIHRRVALKIIKLGMDTKQVIARFETEREALALMNHPNVAKVFDAGATETGRPYFVMEYVAGIPITDYCDKHRLNTEERLRLFMDVCHAVQHAHQKGIIHRDIKPSNVLVAVQDDKPVPKVIDFGVAKATQHRLTERTVYTEQGQLVGTPGYMSPEQAEMTALDIDTRTDIYSLGVLLYKLLVGGLPLDTKTLLQAGFADVQRIIRQVDPPKPSTKLSSLQSEPGAPATDPSKAPARTPSRLDDIASSRRTEPRTLLRELRGDLDWITMKAMEKDRTRRYATASALAEDILRHVKHEPVLASPPSATYRLKKFMRRNKGPVGAVTAVFVALLVGLIVSTILYLRADRARAETARERDRAITAEAEAKSRRAEAKETINFLNRMVSSVDPTEARGQEFTVKQMLDATAATIDEAFRSQPLVEATLRLTIGNMYRALGKYTAADPHLRRALKLRKERLGEENLEVADALTDLAALLDAQGHYDDAEPLFSDALRIRRKLLGDEHELIAESLTNVGILLWRRGDFEGAEPLWREALAMRRKLLGNEHPLVADSVSNLGALLRNKGDNAAAEQLYREALAMRRKLLGNEHPWVAESLNNLGLVLRDRGDYSGAEAMWRETLAMRRKILGDEHPEIAQTLRHLALVLLDKGDPDAAASMIQEALAMQRKLLGDDHTEAAFSQTVLAQVLLARGETGAAESTLRQAMTSMRKALPATHWMIPHTESLLGGCLTVLGRYDEAEPLLLNAEAALRRVRGNRDRIAIDALQRIVHLYDSWGKPEKAADFRGLLPASDAASPIK